MLSSICKNKYYTSADTVACIRRKWLAGGTFHPNHHRSSAILDRNPAKLAENSPESTDSGRGGTLRVRHATRRGRPRDGAQRARTTTGWCRPRVRAGQGGVGHRDGGWPASLRDQGPLRRQICCRVGWRWLGEEDLGISMEYSFLRIDLTVFVPPRLNLILKKHFSLSQLLGSAR